MHRSISTCWLVILPLFTALAQPAQADMPKVHFDVAAMIGCRDVTPDEFAKANPDERFVEAKVEVSSLIRGGSEDDLIEYFYQFVCRREICQVVDYLPRTTLAADLAGNIGIEKKQEQVRSLGLGVVGSFETMLKFNGSADAGSKRNSQVTYELLPPLELVAASGTIQRSSGVYFKLKPSRRTSLEGSKQFVLVLRVPATWRGALLHLQCRAVGIDSGMFKNSRITQCTDFAVALYLDGNASAKSAASAYVAAERELRRAALANREAIKDQRCPTLVHKLSSAVSAVQPKIPEDWLMQITAEPSRLHPHGFERHLPSEVQSAVSEFRSASTKLLSPLERESDYK